MKNPIIFLAIFQSLFNIVMNNTLTLTLALRSHIQIIFVHFKVRFPNKCLFRFFLFYFDILFNFNS